MTADFSEVDLLAADLTQAGLRAGFVIHAVVEDSCQRVEEDAKASAPKRRLPHYANTINHDVTIGGGVITGEVGPDADVNKQANLAPIFEYGTDKLPPRAHVTTAFDREERHFADRIADAGGRLL